MSLSKTNTTYNHKLSRKHSHSEKTLKKALRVEPNDSLLSLDQYPKNNLSPSCHNYPHQGSLSKINFASTYERAKSKKRFYKLQHIMSKQEYKDTVNTFSNNLSTLDFDYNTNHTTHSDLPELKKNPKQYGVNFNSMTKDMDILDMTI